MKIKVEQNKNSLSQSTKINYFYRLHVFKSTSDHLQKKETDSNVNLLQLLNANFCLSNIKTFDITRTISNGLKLLSNTMLLIV